MSYYTYIFLCLFNLSKSHQNNSGQSAQADLELHCPHMSKSPFPHGVSQRNMQTGLRYVQLELHTLRTLRTALI